MASKLEKSVAEARAKFEASGLAGDELALLRLEKQLADEKLEAAKTVVPVDYEADKAKAIAEAVAKAVGNAVKQNNMPKQRETKKFLDRIVVCDEVIVERSENNNNELTLVETLRQGVTVTEAELNIFNQSILGQSRAKVLVPQKDKKAFLSRMGK